MSKDLNYQLGKYVGEYITAQYLPTLSTDLLQTRNIVEVSEEDAKIHNELDSNLTATYKWNGGDGDSNAAFEEYRKFNHLLAKKYLPEKLICLVPKVHPTDMDQFLEGLKDQLWNTDLSHYWPEDDYYKEAEEWAWCCTITLTLRIG